MADWDEEVAMDAPAGEEEMIPPTANMPEIHLFGKWSCEDVQVPDISLQVGRELAGRSIGDGCS